MCGGFMKKATVFSVIDAYVEEQLMSEKGEYTDCSGYIIGQQYLTVYPTGKRLKRTIN